MPVDDADQTTGGPTVTNEDDQPSPSQEDQPGPIQGDQVLQSQDDQPLPIKDDPALPTEEKKTKKSKLSMWLSGSSENLLNPTHDDQPSPTLDDQPLPTDKNKKKIKEDKKAKQSSELSEPNQLGLSSTQDDQTLPYDEKKKAKKDKKTKQPSELSDLYLVNPLPTEEDQPYQPSFSVTQDDQTLPSEWKKKKAIKDKLYPDLSEHPELSKKANQHSELSEPNPLNFSSNQDNQPLPADEKKKKANKDSKDNLYPDLSECPELSKPSSIDSSPQSTPSGLTKLCSQNVAIAAIDDQPLPSKEKKKKAKTDKKAMQPSELTKPYLLDALSTQDDQPLPTEEKVKKNKKTQRSSEGSQPYWIREMDLWSSKKKQAGEESEVILNDGENLSSADYFYLDWDQSEAFGNKVDPSMMSVNDRYRHMAGVLGMIPDWLLRLFFVAISIVCWYHVYQGLFVRQTRTYDNRT